MKRNPFAGRRPFRQARQDDPFLRAKHGDLDIVMPPPYDMSDHSQRQAREQVERMIGRLQPGAIDGNSRDVLNNLINAWMDQEIARLGSQREERKAVSGILIGLAREEVSRRKHCYEADLARAQHAHQVLAIAFDALTGSKMTGLPSPHPPQLDDGPLRSALGTLRLSRAALPPAGEPEAGGTSPGDTPPGTGPAIPTGEFDPYQDEPPSSGNGNHTATPTDMASGSPEGE
jgi:hypothetical protein